MQTIELQRTPERQAVYEQVIRLLIQGEKPRTIAATYGISTATVRNWKCRYLRKQGKYSKSQLHSPAIVTPDETEIAPVTATETLRNVLANRALTGISITDDLRLGLAQGLGDIQSTLINSASALAEMTSKNAHPVTYIDESGVLLNYAPLGLNEHKSAVGTVKSIADVLSKMHNLIYGVQAAPKEQPIKEGSKHLHYHSHGGNGARPSGKVIYRHDVPKLPAPDISSVIDVDMIETIDAQEVD